MPAISRHIYGANIKALERDRWDEDSARFVSFSSGVDPRRRRVPHGFGGAGRDAAQCVTGGLNAMACHA